jgi:hypothetical protein
LWLKVRFTPHMMTVRILRAVRTIRNLKGTGCIIRGA